MTGTAIATSGGKNVAVKYNPAAFDFTKMKAAANAASKAMDGKELKEGQGLGQHFPGIKYQWNGKTNVWSTYDFSVKDKAERTTELDDGFNLIFNYQQVCLCWKKVEEVGTGKDAKKRSVLKHLTPFLDAETMPTREELGDLDQDEWEVSADGNPLDPWKLLTVIPVRDVDSDTVNHIELGNKTAARAFMYLYQRLAAEAPLHMGQLPVVEVSTKVHEYEVQARDKKTGEPLVDKKTGKPKMAKVAQPQPVFRVVTWTDMLECDVPKESADEIEASDDVGEVESRERNTAPKAVEKTEVKVNKGSVKRKVQAVEDDEDSI